MIRIATAPGVRRLVRPKLATPAEIRESPDDDDRTPMWCASCRRELLFDLPRCPDCGGAAVSSEQLARLNHERRPGVPGPSSW